MSQISVNKSIGLSSLSLLIGIGIGYSLRQPENNEIPTAALPDNDHQMLATDHDSLNLHSLPEMLTERTIVAGEQGSDKPKLNLSHKKKIDFNSLSLDDLIAHIGKATDENNKDRPGWMDIRECLRAMVLKPDGKGLEKAIALLEDPYLQFSHRADSFSYAFDGIKNPLLIGAVDKAIENAKSLGETSQLKGYFDVLLAQDSEGCKAIFEFITDNNFQVAHSAVEALAEAEGSSDRTKSIGLLNDLTSNAPKNSERKMLGRMLIESLGKWKDPEVQAKIEGIALGQGDIIYREAALKECGMSGSDQCLLRIEQAYLASGQQDKNLILNTLYGAAERNDPNSLGVCERILRDALSNGSDPQLVDRALNILSDSNNIELKQRPLVKAALLKVYSEGTQDYKIKAGVLLNINNQ